MNDNRTAPQRVYPSVSHVLPGEFHESPIMEGSDCLTLPVVMLSDYEKLQTTFTSFLRLEAESWSAEGDVWRAMRSQTQLLADDRASLLAALKALTASVPKALRLNEEYNAAWRAARDAIAKAEGRA